MSVVISSQHAINSPEPIACCHETTSPKDRQRQPRRAGRHADELVPVSPFVIHLLRITSPKLERPATALQRNPHYGFSKPTVFYSGHTPTHKRLNHLADQDQAPGDQPRRLECFPV